MCARALEPAAADEQPSPSLNDDGAEADAQLASPTAMLHARKRTTPPVAAALPNDETDGRRVSPRVSPRHAPAATAAPAASTRSAFSVLAAAAQARGGARAQPHQGSSKASFKAARKDAKLECSVECRRHKEEHCRRFANRSVPARGFATSRPAHSNPKPTARGVKGNRK